ncbi:MAG: DUF4956 domain-containing protein [Clostridia bacterium]|nr:DUF4956 domain-containing protein [Clostridia bacterium]
MSMLERIGNGVSSVLNLQDVNVPDILMTIILAFVLGLVIGWVYKMTHTGFGYSQSFVITLVMMSAVISLVILVVGNNTARAFSLAGALSIIRFRMSLREPKDIAYVFFATAAGLAVGAGAYIYAIIGVVILGLFIIILSKLNAFAPSFTTKKLKIVIPEDLDYEGRFDEVLKKYCDAHVLVKVMNIDLGTLFELVYDVKVKSSISEKEFLDELRTLNGNLRITLALASEDSED